MSDQEDKKPVTVNIDEAQKEELGKAQKAIEEQNRTPRCGYCGLDPLRVHIDDELNENVRPPLATRTIICQRCRCVLNITVLGIQQSAVDPRVPSRRIM